MKNRRPSVAILVANLPAEKDRRVIRECLSLEAAGFDVTVIAPRGDRSLTVLPGSERTRLRPYPVVVYGSGVLSFALEFVWSFLWIAIRLAGELIRGRAQAVQVCNPPDVYFPLAWVLRALGRPWVFDHHDLSPEVYISRGGDPNPLVSRLLVAFEWLTLRSATEVFATNESFKENAVRRGVRPEKVTVVRNGPAHAEIANKVEAVAEVRAEGPLRVVYLGVFGPQDNVEGAVLAAEELIRLRGRNGWRMVLAGDGETASALRKLTVDRGLTDVVEFTGWLNGPEVDALLRDATVAIQPDLPTRMNQLSTMAKTVEYLGRGVPVVAADLIETRATVGDAGLYVPRGEPAEFAAAIDRLLDDPELRARMHQIGRERFRDFLSWEHQAEKYVAVWQRLLAKHLPRAAGVHIPAQRRPADETSPTRTDAP
ncbi:glycosyltransferase family 4 protein [Actinoplanes xinjiangensis]|uniref:Glycosyltransferase involved in cell wall biosynthesis n=1 Tax=Actinoplanes xinjiangensis TaxID=512350 RepID=A0A316FLL4_9ACTN|nr:glycosyltransferase family 4 protein [Actinoplanes xinjiangensis]PWK49002.1 glycosyltransferase involved in cell wall biosynthesis [Actinoplanes xinjiangensis]GIF38709.1 glycosyltransferase WbuB [Actinoplanes xinjiangensis]